jgi:hypothetical protein
MAGCDGSSRTLSAGAGDHPVSASLLMRPSGNSLAFVLFADSPLSYLRLLKPRFRHCMIVLGEGGDWVLLDPMSNGLQLTKLGALPPSELQQLFQENGLVVVPVQRAAPRQRELPLGPATCVEVVKRCLALRGRFVLTPWQLYRRLTRRGA